MVARPCPEMARESSVLGHRKLPCLSGLVLCALTQAGTV